jgi:hypothetical protein
MVTLLWASFLIGQADIYGPPNTSDLVGFPANTNLVGANNEWVGVLLLSFPSVRSCAPNNEKKQINTSS